MFYCMYLFISIDSFIQPFYLHLCCVEDFVVGLFVFSLFVFICCCCFVFVCFLFVFLLWVF